MITTERTSDRIRLTGDSGHTAGVPAGGLPAGRRLVLITHRMRKGMTLQATEPEWVLHPRHAPALGLALSMCAEG